MTKLCDRKFKLPIILSLGTIIKSVTTTDIIRSTSTNTIILSNRLGSIQHAELGAVIVIIISGTTATTALSTVIVIKPSVVVITASEVVIATVVVVVVVVSTTAISLFAVHFDDVVQRHAKFLLSVLRRHFSISLFLLLLYSIFQSKRQNLRL
jgi:hypothetical protein